MKPIPLPKYFAGTFFQDILTHLEDAHALWSPSTQPLKFLFPADKAMKDTLPLLTALPHIQHATAKENKQPSHSLGLPCQAHLVPSMEPAVWGQPDPERRLWRGGRWQTTLLERPLASHHLHCPHRAPAARRVPVGEFTELMDTHGQWRTGSSRRQLLSGRRGFSTPSGRMPRSMQAAVTSVRDSGFISSLEWGGGRYPGTLRFSSRRTGKHLSFM